ncbi:Hint domain-containing protein [Thioclava sp. BHET1]|nr:Hint domain-containing protein [Thioclava sp. BHET1]
MAELSRSLDDTFAYNGSLIDLTGTLLLSSFTPQSSGELTVDDTDNEKDWDFGEAATWNGDNATYLGEGTATSGVSLNLGILGSINVGLSSPVDVVAWQAGGSTYVNYPNGDQASLLDGLVSQIENNALFQSLGLTTVLNILGVTDLTQYVEDNALLTFDIDQGNSFDLPVCFTRGTLIDTVFGPVPVEELEVGDMVITQDDGPRPIRWIGRRRVQGKGNFAPVRIASGTLGNKRDLMVSQQHRILLSDWRASLLFGEDEVLAAAKHLINDTTIRLMPCEEVEYFHLLFDQHQILTSDNCLTESFHPGDIALGALAEDAKSEVLDLFPDLGSFGWQSYGQSARMILREYQTLAMREGH